MTIKELAEFTGKTERTIQNWVKKSNEVFSLDSEKISLVKGQETNLTIDQVETILNAGSMSKDAVRILMENARQPKEVAPVLKNENMQMFADMMAQSLAVALKPIYDRLDNVEKTKTLQLEHVPDMPSRTLFRKLIDELVSAAKVDHSTAYNRVYSEMGYLYGVKIKARAKNSNIKPIDVLERDDLMGKAVAVTRQFLKTVKDRNGVS